YLVVVHGTVISSVSLVDLCWFDSSMSLLVYHFQYHYWVG
ncbi:7271_t:CDS:2, partial [Racocetra persica]